jgi:hypothetical protein
MKDPITLGVECALLRARTAVLRTAWLRCAAERERDHAR